MLPTNLGEYDRQTAGFELDMPPDAPLNPAVLSPDTTAWPWLHEDLFLQDDINLDWFHFTTDANNPATTTRDSPHLHQLCGSTSGSAVTPQNQLHLRRRLNGDHAPNEASRATILDTLISGASRAAKSNDLSFFSRLSSTSTQIRRDFELFSPEVGTAASQTEPRQDPLQPFLQLYEKHFWPLWPFTPRHRLQCSNLEPLLYLAMVSIGAMYGGRQASIFGTSLHLRLREGLVNPLLDIDMTRKPLLALAQARSLTQAAALYFGQKKAFSYAQHLGGALVAQARRMNLFISPPAETLPQSKDASAFVDIWIVQESRKRLAYAILRLEMYTSVLHSTRPLVSGEEIDLGLPCSHTLWSTWFKSDETFAAAIRQELATNGTNVPFSDLITLALEPAGRLPYLNMLHLELLMNGMQEQVWRSCTAKTSRQRLTSCGSTVTEPVVEPGFGTSRHTLAVYAHDDLVMGPRMDSYFGSIDDYIAQGSRTMNRLGTVMHDTVASMMKLRNEVLNSACIQTPSPGMNRDDRSSLLSCLLAFHLAFIQLNAPMRTIHHICHSEKDANGRKQDTEMSSVRAWVKSESAPTAVRHAIKIYDLLKGETEKPVDHRARINFLTMIGLYHSATLVWTYITLRPRLPTQQEQSSAPSISQASEEPSCTATPSMADFQRVLHDINPVWAGRSSFSAAITRLGQLDLSSSPQFMVAEVDNEQELFAS